jgi:hypothetical protein
MSLNNTDPKAAEVCSVRDFEFAKAPTASNTLKTG